MKKQQYIALFYCPVLFLLMTGCRKNEPILDAVPEPAYVRIFTDFDVTRPYLSDPLTQTYKYLYLNGDFQADRQINLNSPKTGDSDEINIPSVTGSNGNYIFFIDSYYSYGSIALGSYLNYNGGANSRPYYNYYPNFFNRVRVAPIINRYDFYKWAQVPSGKLRLSFTTVPLNGKSFDATASGALADTVTQVSKGGVYTYILTRNPDNTKYQLLEVNEQPAQVKFEAGYSYLRLINVTSATQNFPADLDVYLLVRRVNAPVLPDFRDYTQRDTIVADQFIGTVSGTFDGKAPFLKLPLIADTAFRRNGALRTDIELPGFILKFYKKGDKPSAGKNPLITMQSAYGPKAFNFDYQPPYSSIPTEIADGAAIIQYPYLFDPLGGIHPTYGTIIFGVRNNGNVRTLGLTRYLWEPADASNGFRR